MKRIFWAVSFWAVVFAVVVADAHQARAGGFSSLDFGSRRMGGFTVVGRPDDATAIFHNPAGLTLRSGNDLYVYGALIIGDLAMRFYDSTGILRPDHEVEPDFNIGALPFLALTTDLGTEAFRLGVGIYAPNGFGAAMPEDEPTRYHVTQALFVTSSATLAAAYKFGSVLSAGLSISLIHTYLNAGRFMNLGVLNDPDERFLPKSQTQEKDFELVIEGQAWSWTWAAGLLLSPTPWLSLGASFTAGSDMSLEGPVTLTSFKGEVVDSRHRTGMVLPYSLRAGANWDVAPDFELSMDVTYWHYQVLQEQRSELTTPLLGMSEFRDLKNHGNSVLWAVGLNYHVTPELEVLMGWQMDFTPTPTATYSIQTPSRDSKGVAVGTRWQATPSIRLGAAFNRIWFDLVDIQDSQTLPPTNVKGHGGMLYFAVDMSYSF